MGDGQVCADCGVSLGYGICDCDADDKSHPRVLSVTSCADDCPFFDLPWCTASDEDWREPGKEHWRQGRPTWCPLEGAGVLVRVAREGE